MPQLTLALLGPPGIERDGAPLAVDTRKAVALLALLALADTPLTRAALSAMLWPEFDRSHARAALRRTLSVLKKGVGEGVLVIDRHTLAIAADADLHIDVAEFRAAWRASAALASDDPDAVTHLERAAALYRGDLLEGFGLRDSAPFDDWQFEQADTLRRELAQALERLVELHGHLGDLERALGHARRWLELDPLHEGVHRTLMRLLAWSGRRSEALQQYRHCVRVLEQELGVAPLEATEALYRAIKEGSLSPSPEPTPAPIASPATTPPTDPTVTAGAPSSRPLVGRAAAWRALEAARERGAERRFLLTIEGEAGIGKTYLAEAFLERVADSGGATLSARCYPDQHHLAYGPVIDLLRAALARPGAAERVAEVDLRWLGEASRLAPDLAALVPALPPPPPLDGPAGRSHLFEGVDRLLARLLAGPRTAALLLDDAHWADPATLELFTYLARPERPPGLLLLAALRSERSEAHEHLLRHLSAGEREGRAHHLTLERWGREEVGELLRQRGSELDGEGAERLFEESEGLPFFVSEYLAALAQRGTWEELPQGVRDLLRSRLGAADAVERQLLQTAAAIGRSFEFDRLRRASGRADDEVVAGLERLVALDLVREIDGADGAIRFDFGHEKLRALVYDDTSLVRRRLLHGRIADTLLSDGSSAPGHTAAASLVGFHLRLAGREQEAALQFARAGDHARSLFANQEALHHYRTALALGHPEPATLHEAIGDLHTLAGAYDSAIADFETAAALGEPSQLGRLEHRLGNVHQRSGAWETAESHYLAAAELFEANGNARERARLLTDRSLNAHRRGLADEAFELARRAQSFGERSGDVPTLAQVHNLLGMLAHRRGDLTASTHDLELSLALTAETPDPSARIAALNNLALVRAEAGDPDAGLELLEAALTLCQRQGDRHREAALLNNSADLLHASGRREEAMERLKRAAAIYAAIGQERGDWQPEIWKLVEW